MSFGTDYESRDYNRIVPEGDYVVTLGMPIDKQVSGYDVRVFPVSIEGFPGYMPKEWTVFDCPRDDVEKIAKWNEQRTRDFDVFGVRRGDFEPRSWYGKKGKVHIGKDKAGYMKVLWSVSGDSQTAPNTQAQPSAQASTQANKGTDFPDDIPF